MSAVTGQVCFGEDDEDSNSDDDFASTDCTPEIQQQQQQPEEAQKEEPLPAGGLPINESHDFASMMPTSGEVDIDALNSMLLSKLQPSLVGISDRMNELLESQQGLIAKLQNGQETLGSRKEIEYLHSVMSKVSLYKWKIENMHNDMATINVQVSRARHQATNLQLAAQERALQKASDYDQQIQKNRSILAQPASGK